MNKEQFKTLLHMDRECAGYWLMERKVEEWLNDGQEEVVRCLSCWIAQRLNLGDDKLLIEMADGAGFFVDADEKVTVYVAGNRTDKNKDGLLYDLFAGPVTKDEIEMILSLPPPPRLEKAVIRMWALEPLGNLKTIYQRKDGAWHKVRQPQ